jgi:hypothetical protein
MSAARPAITEIQTNRELASFENHVSIYPNSAFHSRSPFLCSHEHVNPWELNASRRRPAFASHLVNAENQTGGIDPENASAYAPRYVGLAATSRFGELSKDVARTRAEIIFTFIAGILLRSSRLASTFADHLLLSKGDAKEAAKKSPWHAICSLGTMPGVAKSAAAEKAL